MDLYLNDEFTIKGDVLTITKEDLKRSSITLYQEAVLKAILNGKNSLSDNLPNYLTRVIKLSNKNLNEIEHTIVDSLKGIDAIEEIPSLLGCDLEFHTAGVSMKEYRSNEEFYTRVTESLRTEILEVGVMTDEAILMLLLLRESGCLYDIFSKDNLEQVASCMNELFESDSWSKQILTVNIHKSLETAIKNFLKIKKEIMSTPIASGFNFVFPFFERSQSVFIDTEAYFSNKEERLRDVKARLEHYGHTFTVIREGAVPIIKIDNFLYEAIPYAMPYEIPVHGVRLKKYPLYC
jgi:hypothetical protein